MFAALEENARVEKFDESRRSGEESESLRNQSGEAGTTELDSE